VDSDDDAPQSGQILGILKQMEEEMTNGLEEATAAERTSVKSYDELFAAKTNEVEILTAQIEAEQARIGELGVEIAMMENDMENSKKSAAEDTKFLAELGTNCAKKEKEWDEIEKMRFEELTALTETIKMLNDDDALEVFKKTLPSAAVSLLQVQVSAATLRTQALTALRGTAHSETESRDAHLPARPQVDLIALALRGNKIGFDKLITMIDEMSANLKKEQVGDDTKKAYCEKQLDLSGDKKKELEREVSDSEAAIDELKGSIETLTEEIAALKKGIVSLDESVAEATQQRKTENAEYKELKGSDTQAKAILMMAKNRLNKFYAPKLYTPEREAASFVQVSSAHEMGSTETFAEEIAEVKKGIVELDESVAEATQQRKTDNYDYKDLELRINDTLAKEDLLIARTKPNKFYTPPVYKPEGDAASFVQVAAQQMEAPPPPPETFAAYTKKSGKHMGVSQMIELLIRDLDKELVEAEVNEKESQKDYEVLMAEANTKRADDSRALSDKTFSKAAEAEVLERQQDTKASTSKELMGTLEYIHSLHGECDFLLKYYDARANARADELDALSKARAILSGADLSLLQTDSTRQ